MLGIEPSGAITFVSKVYESSISDKEIVKRSGILNKSFWDDNDLIMAYWGFTIQNKLAPSNVELYNPSFLGGRVELTAKRSQRMTSNSFRAKRYWKVITRIKKFKPLNHITLTVHDSVNQIWTVLCILCNSLPTLIQSTQIKIKNWHKYKLKNGKK